jgi:small-conductance mechanosensitive channel
MNAKVQAIETVTVEPLEQAYRTIAGYLPHIVGALAILLVGWLVAIVLRKVVGKALRAIGLDVISERTGVIAMLQRGQIHKRPSELLGCGVYWLILFSALVGTFNALGLEIASTLLRAVVLYIPSILIALLLLGLGFFVSRYIDTLATAAAATLNMPFPDAWGRAAQTLILFIVGVMVLEELGIATQVVSLGFVMLLAVLGLAAVVAFGLGTKEVAAQLAAGQCLRHMFEPGDVVQYSSYEGTVQEIGFTHLSLKTDQGLVTIPNTVFLHTTILKRLPQETTSDNAGVTSGPPPV